MSKPIYTPKALKDALFGEEGYFPVKRKEANKRKKPDSGSEPFCYLSISDMCNHLDISYSTWSRYRSHRTGKYDHVIAIAEQNIVSEWVKNLYYSGRNATGAIFYLKNISRFSDRQSHVHSVEGSVASEHRAKLSALTDEQIKALKDAFEGNGKKDKVIEIEADN